jgi:hypothetical protein
VIIAFCRDFDVLSGVKVNESFLACGVPECLRKGFWRLLPNIQKAGINLVGVGFVVTKLINEKLKKNQDLLRGAARNELLVECLKLGSI